jgi:hypothetical protein
MIYERGEDQRWRSGIGGELFQQFAEALTVIGEAGQE